MSDTDKNVGPRVATGEFEGTGAELRVLCGFRPAIVMVHNVDGNVGFMWNNSMADDAGFKITGAVSGGASATINAGYLVYQVRENPSALDYNDGTEKAWTELDLSGIVPANTKAVALRVTLSDDTVGSYIRVQQNGEGNQSYDTHDMMAQVAGRSQTQTMIVEVDGDRKIKYSVEDAGGASVTVFSILVVGWFETVSLPTGAHTHTSLSSAFVTSDGITPYKDGFVIGADTDVNVGAETMYWTAWKF